MYIGFLLLFLAASVAVFLVIRRKRGKIAAWWAAQPRWVRVSGKWTLIVALCGSNSFFWGLMVAKWWPMILGMVTLVAAFTLVDLHPRYQNLRRNDALFARAVDLGLKIRMIWAVWIPLPVIVRSIPGVFTHKAFPLNYFLDFPLTVELYIGMFTTTLTKILTGIYLPATSPKEGRLAPPPAGLPQDIAVYFTTLTTGLIHTLLLALLCGVIYFVLKKRALKKVLPP